MKSFIATSYLFFLLAFSHAQNRSASPHSGEGTVSITIYILPYKSNSPDIIPDSDRNYFNKYVYYIKGEKIYRDDLKDEKKVPDNQANTVTSSQPQLILTASFIHPRYLIDLDRNLAYTYSGSDTAIVDSLKDLMSEPFYRMPFVKRTVTIDSLPETAPVSIAGRTCYKGYASTVTNKVTDHISFYYTKDHIFLHSPLNRVLTPAFTYTVIAFKGNAPYKDENGSTQIGTAFVQSTIKEIPLADTIFPPIRRLLIH